MTKKLEPKGNLELVFKDCRDRSKDGELYVSFFDGNKIKQVNDNFGHLVGDFVIERLATIILQNIRDEDRLIRFGGDEFVLMLPNFCEGDIKAWIHRIQKAIKTDTKLLEKVGGITTSVGVVKFSKDKHKNLEGVLEQADLLMYRAKKNKAGNYCVFDDDPETLANNTRKENANAVRVRSLFKWASAELKLENKDYIEDLLRVVVRSYWRRQGEMVLHTSVTTLLEDLRISYDTKYKDIVKKYIRKRITELQKGSRDAEILLEIQREVEICESETKEELWNTSKS